MCKLNNSNKNFSSHALSIERKLFMLYDELHANEINIIHLNLHIIATV